MKKIVKVLPAISFAIGWIAGRGTVQDGFNNGEVVIGGLVVAGLYAFILWVIKENAKH